MSRRPGLDPFTPRPMSSWMRFLIIANTAGFGMAWLVGAPFYQAFGLVPAHFWHDRFLWQAVSHLFVHARFMDLFFYLITLWFFALPLESEWGAWEFGKYYLLCGVGGGVIGAAVQPASSRLIIGASPAIFGILAAFAMAHPDVDIYFYGLFPIKARHIAVLYGLLDFFSEVPSASFGPGQIAYIGRVFGGMAVGYLYLRWWWELEIRARSAWRRWSGASGRLSRRLSAAAADLKKPPLGGGDDELDREVDRILDKISASGQESLSPEERDILRKGSERKQARGGRA